MLTKNSDTAPRGAGDSADTPSAASAGDSTIEHGQAVLALLRKMAAKDRHIGTLEAWLAQRLNEVPKSDWATVARESGRSEAEATLLSKDLSAMTSGGALCMAKSIIMMAKWAADGERLLPHLQLPPPTPFNIALEKLVERVKAEVRQGGKIPDGQLNNDWWLNEVLSGWANDVERDKQDDLAKLLDETKRPALLLQRQLEKLHPELAKTREVLDSGYDYGSYNRLHTYLTPTGLTHVSDMISALLRAIECIGGKTTRGRSRGSKKYPGLDELVHGMESYALSNGGKGFGIPTTQPPKGRIIHVLDRLRVHLKNDPELAHLARFLPLPGLHPARIYQRAICEAREEHAAHLAAEARELL